MAETVTVSFSLQVGKGEVAASAIVPAGQTNLTALLPVIQSLEDAVVHSAIADEASAGRTISCRAGCGACCRQMVPISIFEAKALGNWIGSLPKEEQQGLALRFDNALRALGKTGLIDRMVTEDWFADTEASRRMAMDYLYQRVACPFLVE